jgi:predicted dehydrogenase
LEREGDKQADWRTDPARAGVGGCIGDIGTHAFNLAEFVGGAPVTRLCADLAAVVPGRALDDDCNVLLRFADGARGVLIASQISAGARNGLKLQVYGEKGGVSWSHERPNELTVDWLEGPTHVLHAGSGDLSAAARGAARLPTGHPEGFIEAFANLYRDFADAIRAGRDDAGLVPGINEGVRGMAFVETAVAASRADAGWVDLEGTGA